jgi:hypothetical protein
MRAKAHTPPLSGCPLSCAHISQMIGFAWGTWRPLGAHRGVWVARLPRSGPHGRPDLVAGSHCATTVQHAILPEGA